MRRFQRDERGSAMTEFVMFMPIWVTLFAGIFALGKAGIYTTRTPIKAQKQLWTNVINAGDTPHMVPNAAALAAPGTLAASRTRQSNNAVANGFEAVTWSGALGLGGTIGESYQRTVILGAISNDIDPEMSFENIVPSERIYPTNALDDGTFPLPSMSMDSIGSVIASFVNASGAILAVGAGARYGVVGGEVTGEQIRLARGFTITSNARYDILVAPKAMDSTGEAENVPYTMARLMAESDEKYAVMMNFSESEWTSGPSGSYDVPDLEGRGRDEADHKDLDEDQFDNADDLEQCVRDPSCNSHEDFYPDRDFSEDGGGNP